MFPGTDCPIGTYSNTSGLVSVDECTDCDPGMYCDSPGLTQPTGECAAGHYCLSAAIRLVQVHARQAPCEVVNLVTFET